MPEHSAPNMIGCLRPILFGEIADQRDDEHGGDVAEQGIQR